MRAARLIRMAFLVQLSPGLTAVALARELDVSERTVIRDVQASPFLSATKIAVGPRVQPGRALAEAAGPDVAPALTRAAKAAAMSPVPLYYQRVPDGPRALSQIVRDCAGQSRRRPQVPFSISSLHPPHFRRLVNS